VIPLGIDITLDESNFLICGNITARQIKEGYLMPVRRIDQWEKADYKDLTAVSGTENVRYVPLLILSFGISNKKGEQTTLLIVACLFFLTMLLGCYTLYCAISSSGIPYNSETLQLG